ncbi:hypothetical protein BUALT_Bualt04G0068900 [Buddleja alternifolia]|uniref:MULE transposase domain-containing protein n=1 Tax=Buddleja alternifolia TaxID=168488 RepID=A0AAV6XTE2_9LAMI|nr:hypothetical protein BUALT_Bualt04G0068900 [Buddleja alternifolia]
MDHRGHEGPPRYIPEENNFTLKVNHGGQLLELPSKPSFTGLLEGTEVDVSIGEEVEEQCQGKGGTKDANEIIDLDVEGGFEGGLGTKEGVHGGLDSEGGVQGGLDSEAGGDGGLGTKTGSGGGLGTETGGDSTCEDSTDDDGLYDPDYDLSEDDDMLYKKYVDPEVEFSNAKAKRKEKVTEQMESRFFDEIEVNVDEEGNTSSDELESLCSDKEGDDAIKFIRFNPKTNMHDPKFLKGMVFTVAMEFKEVVRVHAVVWQRNVVFVKNDQSRIRTLNTSHKCGRTLSKNKFVTSRLLSNKYKTDWRLNNGWKVGDFKEKVHLDLNCEISTSQYYRTKRKVNDMLKGQYMDQYARLWDYSKKIKRSNPNSTVVLKTYVDSETGEDKFKRFYVCFDACRKGVLQGCRPLIGVDGCHLKGSHKGILLTAVGLDPNNCIFPICYSVTEAEDKETWKWFLELVIGDLGIYDQDKWTFISDRQKGLLPALYELLPDIEHRYCVMHMYNNFKKEHPGLALKDRLWNVARATTVNQFKFQMASLKEFDEGAHNWLTDVLPRHWSRSHFRTFPKCDILLNNICESFNAAILEARNKPLLSTMECIRVYLMKRMLAKRECLSRWNIQVCPKILKKLEKLKDNTRSCISIYAGMAKFESQHSTPVTEFESEQPGQTEDGGAQPGQTDNGGAQPGRPISKRKCSVCLQPGHYRSKYPYPAGRMWKNYDRYAFNFGQSNVSGEVSGTAVAPPVAPSIALPAAPSTANISGVSLKASFVKKGRNCVTLKSLETAASSRPMKVPFDGCSAKKTKS